MKVNVKISFEESLVMRFVKIKCISFFVSDFYFFAETIGNSSSRKRNMATEIRGCSRKDQENQRRREETERKGFEGADSLPSKLYKVDLLSLNLLFLTLWKLTLETSKWKTMKKWKTMQHAPWRWRDCNTAPRPVRSASSEIQTLFGGRRGPMRWLSIQSKLPFIFVSCKLFLM